MNRRSFLKLLAAVPFAPIKAFLPARKKIAWIGYMGYGIALPDGTVKVVELK